MAYVTVVDDGKPDDEVVNEKNPNYEVVYQKQTDDVVYVTVDVYDDEEGQEVVTTIADNESQTTSFPTTRQASAVRGLENTFTSWSTLEDSQAQETSSDSENTEDEIEVVTVFHEVVFTSQISVPAQSNTVYSRAYSTITSTNDEPDVITVTKTAHKDSTTTQSSKSATPSTSRKSIASTTSTTSTTPTTSSTKAEPAVVVVTQQIQQTKQPQQTQRAQDNGNSSGVAELAGGVPSDDGFAQTILDLLNKLRASKGLKQLRLDGTLTAAALDQSQYQASINTMTHDNSNYGGLLQRFSASGASCSGAAENVGKGSSDPEELFTLWMNSPPHLENMLGDYGRMGAAVFEGYSAQTFCN
ncbi:hypothetical protein AX774_g684 [Zancudomyces culisetae]|uniref:SCP domain-containing protein n=1 Tax=Zancudomyces culisetae TaxID=1213189 RepID=A0A1R1PXS2_ZANCU|nr:hypothetical protein AX774_g684 [Zancudomyces culisetae]|eukprot:OMH85771.1 hypothetical protein AX774_g684 [Zancudomyces culisetae]